MKPFFSRPDRRVTLLGAAGRILPRVVPVSVLLAAAAIGLALYSCASAGSGRDRYGGIGTAAGPVPFMSAVRTGTLPNGLTYYILKNSKPENRAFLTLAVHAGSLMEQDDEQGLAHFVEHMGFNGTSRFPGAELRGYLRSLGMRFGADLNAYTYFDETVYRLEAPVETSAEGVKRVPARALAILDDWAHTITFAPEAVEAERSVILEEIRARSGVGRRISRQLFSTLLDGSRYPSRWPDGLPEIIGTAPAEKLRAFYQTWYRPDNMAVIIVGDFDDVALEAELASHFTAPPPDLPFPARPDAELPPPVRDRFRVKIITDPEYPYTVINAYYKTEPQKQERDLAYYRDRVLQNLIARIISRRFDEAADNPENHYTEADAGESRFGETSHFYVMAAVSKPGFSRETLRALMVEKESIRRYGFTESETDLAKRALVSGLRRRESERDRQESDSYIDDFSQHFLRAGIVPGVEWELRAVESLLPGIGSRELAAAARSLFAANDLTIAITAPEAEAAHLPTAEEVRRIIAEAARARIPRPVEKAVTGELLDTEPEPGAITGAEEDAETGAVRLTLSNGATVIVQNTANRNNEIVFFALSRGGVSAVPEAEAVSARLAAELAQASGAGPYTRAELVQRLAGRQVSLSFQSGLYQRSIEGSATREDLKTLFELLWLTFTQPRIDGEAVRVVADEYRTALARRGENPESFFSDEVERVNFGNNPWRRPLTPEDIDALDGETALRYIRRASNPGDYTFIFTGNIDVDLAAPYLETYLASIPGPAPAWNSYTDAGIARPGKTERRIYQGREEKSLVFLSWFKPESYSPAGEAAAAVLAEYLDIVFIEEFREKLGEIYTISAGAILSPTPPPGELILQSYFACDPGRAEELSGAIIRELEAIAQGRVDGDSFTKAVEAMKESWEAAMQNNRSIARNYANLSVTLQLPLGTLLALPARYDAVRPQDLQNLCRALIPRGPARIILYPEERP
jgi:zinc protease